MSEGLRRALSTPISDMIKNVAQNVATGYLYQSNGTNNRILNRNSGGTPRQGEEWRRMPLNVVMKIVSIHDHPLELQKQQYSKRPEQMTESEQEEASWQCNGVELFYSGCKSGQTDFELHEGTKSWICRHEEN